MTLSTKKRRLDACRHILSLFSPGRCVDLGTGHGKFAVQAADLGWTVTAVDARVERWPEDSRVRWVQGDIREFALDEYDLILCLGLFYHLSLEDQLSFLARAAGRPVLLDTHLDHGSHVHRLSERVSIDGYEGRLYQEPNALTSGWNNQHSFWPTLSSFRQMLTRYGFSNVLTLEPWITADRTFFLAIPDSRNDSK